MSFNSTLECMSASYRPNPLIVEVLSKIGQELPINLVTIVLLIFLVMKTFFKHYKTKKRAKRTLHENEQLKHISKEMNENLSDEVKI